MRNILENRNYRKKEFIDWLSDESKLDREEVKKSYEIYKEFRDNEKYKNKLEIEIICRLLKLLEIEINKYGKKNKKT